MIGFRRTWGRSTPIGSSPNDARAACRAGEWLRKLALVAAVLALAGSATRAANPPPNSKKADPPEQKAKAGDDQESRKLEAARVKLRKTIERTIGPRESNYYLVAIAETTYHQTVVRKAAVVVGNLVDRQSEVRNAGPGELLPIETVHFHVKQGREDCIQFVYDELTKPPSAPAGAKAPASRAKPSLGAGNWKLLGRFKTEAQAQAAAEKSEAAYQAEPHWEPSDE